MKAIYRAVDAQDFASILRINRESTPGVSAMSPDELDLLAGFCEFSRVVELDGEILGYVFAMRAGLTYDGEEYRWLCDNLDRDFLYIDQIAIARTCKGRGHGGQLYRQLENHAVRNQVDMLACEVNYRPANVASLAFHRKSGFEEITRMKARGYIVSLMVKRGLHETA
jgi:hypothetical protein